MREAQGLPRPSPQPRSPDVPPAPRRPQGLRPQRRQQLRAHHLGRGDLRDRPSLARHHRRVRRPGDHAAELSRQHGPRAGHQLGRSVLQSPRLDGEREDLLHLRLLVGLAADATARPAASTPRASCTASTSSSGRATRSRPTCITGRSCSRRRSAAPRSSSSTPTSRARRRPATGTSARKSRHRRRARHGRHQLDDRAGPRRPGLRRQVRRRLSGA